MGGRVFGEEVPVEDMLEEGTLGCGLEVEPLGHVGFVLKGWEGEMVGGVVLGEEIVCYGAGLGGLSVDGC